MTGPSVTAAKTQDDLSDFCDGEKVVLLLPFLNFDRPVREDSDHSDEEPLEDEFELSNEEDYCYPNELDFYDQKRGQILRRVGGKKPSDDGPKAKRQNCARNVKTALPSSKVIVKRVGDKEDGISNKESRIKEAIIENARRKKENKAKAKKVKGIADVKSESERRPLSSCLKKSVKSNPEINQEAKPPTYYNNSDFVLGSGNSTVKFDDQAFFNLLIELQDREITPEDYDLLVQLDCSVKPKTLSLDKIDRLQSDTVTSALDELCSICMEDYVPGDVRKFLPCRHHFHCSCVKTWLSTTSDRCPIDGKEVR